MVERPDEAHACPCGGRREAARRPAQGAADAGYDVAIIDAPPAVSFETARVAAASDLVLIPLRPSILDIRAVDSTAAVVTASKTKALLVLNACQPPQMLGEASRPRWMRGKP